MQLEKYKKIRDCLESADYILIGLGEEWVLSDEEILKDLEKKDVVLMRVMQHAMNDIENTELKELCLAYYYKNYIPEKLEKAYRKLYSMVCEKEYYVVSLTVDSYLSKVGFDKERIVNPCGTYEWMQCPDACGNRLVSGMPMIDEFGDLLRSVQVEAEMQEIDKIVHESIRLIERYSCEECKKNRVFNQLGCGQYVEDGYLENWKRYMKWLQGTLNKKLCVLEAGVGMKLPTVIRFPFEKTVFYNQKSNMIRIHEKYYQINQEVSERAFGCKCNAVELFGEENLEAF